ncbi:unnamed protein product [Arctia plantaginis]|uniref:Protein arginine N-methyltransferase 9-like n=1 Tax=Arctia plantaginis TaxID=874455 RepID=A0A8S0YP28_ARCPL|nr:unnamed protein product [Arctia plantaginis]
MEAIYFVNYVSLARQQASSKNYIAAFNTYVHAVDMLPAISKEIENEFRTVFLKMNEELEFEKNKEVIFNNFKRVLSIYPSNVDLLNDIGKYLYKYSYYTEALYSFERALSMDTSHVKVEKNLNKAKSSLFPRTLFRSLNDKARNNAYRAAIRSSINPAKDSIINIDAGTGLLALYATECNPIAITACESSNMIIQLADRVIQENLATQVVLVNEPSVLLKQADICGLKSILMTDMIDAGLFGNGLLQSLCHAWDNFLHKQSTIIPGKAEFFVAGVNCVQLNNKYKLCQQTKNILNISHQNVHTTYSAEAYGSEDINLYEDLKYTSEPHSLFTIDFKSRDEVIEMLKKQRPYNAVFNPTVNDEINMIVGWFNLYLTDDIMLTSDPRSENRTRAWQQAVFFDVVPRRVRRNESFSIPFVSYGGRLAAIPESGQVIPRVSRETLVFLNDTEYMNMITKSIGIVCLHVGQTMCLEDVDIVDLSPFPLFGVLMMKRGANSLVCKVKGSEDTAFLNSVLEENGIPASKITILDSDYWSCELYNNKKFHVIFTNIFDNSGEIDVKQQSILHHLQKSHLTSNGICLPASVTVMGQLVYSDELEISNRIIDDNVGCRMAKYVNWYQVSQLSCSDITQSNFVPLSEPFEVASCQDMCSNLVQVPIVQDGVCNAILCWYKVQLIDGWNATCTNRRNSFIPSTAYMTNALRKVFKDDEVNVLLCVDLHGTFKLALDVEPY